ncbi:MAG: hypothetical protein JSW06_10760 [Thermoplasmatales archaeon]|nr:MAG: hypothetical protein JSW06_10760 [Thermoplasmatales archaeon]
MKKILDIKPKIILTVLLSMLMLGSVIATAVGNNQDSDYFNICEDTISVTIPIGTYEIKNTEQGHEISVENLGRLLVPGKPNLPSKIFAIAIPSGAEILEVTFNTGEGIMFPGTYEISPSPLPRVIGQEDPLVYEHEREMYEENYNTVYRNDEPYPQSVGEFVRMAGYRNYNLIDVRITPFIYYPLSGSLAYYPEVTVDVRYTFSDDFSFDDVVVDNRIRTERIAEKIIVNYDQAKNWYPKGTTGRGTRDFVIITLDSLTSSVTPLKNWEESKGRSVEVVTTTWINSNYDGWDLAEKTRNFLRDKYPSDEWGIIDVCFIGHYDDVPMRRTAQNVGYGQPETDYYYAELSLPDDQSWDADGDHQYGEESDPIDFYAEVNVGRIPWSDPATVLSICEKSVAYEQSDDPTFKKNILLLGAFFWPDTDNAVLMEAKVDQTWMSDWSMTRMYEQGQSSYPMDYNLDYNNVKSIWSSGSYGFVDWAGHGSPTACYEYYPSQAFVDTQTCTYLNDDYPAIIFADACSNSDTDYLNIGQAMLKQGGVGFLGSTKVAYGMPSWNNPYSGSSQSLDYFFTTCVTSGDYTQGEAHQWALFEMYTNGLWYYVKYEMFEWGALWGNPNLGMVTAIVNKPPETPGQPDGPTQGVEDRELTYSSSTTDPEGEQIYYMFDWGDNTYSNWIGPYDSGVAGEASHIWIDPGEYDIKVKAKDVNGSESDWSTPLAVTIVGGPFLDMGLISGGLFRVNAVIKNSGATDTSNVKWNIILNGGSILLGKESNGEIPSIPAGGQTTIHSDLIVGFGKIEVIATAEILEGSDTRQQGGTVLLFFVHINPGGGI